MALGWGVGFRGGGAVVVGWEVAGFDDQVQPAPPTIAQANAIAPRRM